MFPYNTTVHVCLTAFQIVSLVLYVTGNSPFFFAAIVPWGILYSLGSTKQKA